jgi:uncharacterized protein (TIGR03085 family)
MPYAEVVALVRSGPPAWSPLGIPGLTGLVNALEYFVHHEDVRRARPGWEPREMDSDVEDLIWSRLGTQGRLMFRRAGVGVTLVRADTGARAAVRGAAPTVTLTGDPAELLLYAFGRRSVARVETGGEAGAVARLASAPLGL